MSLQPQSLSYSVAVRDEDKELIISRRVKLPEQNVVLEKIKKYLTKNMVKRYKQVSVLAVHYQVLAKK